MICKEVFFVGQTLSHDEFPLRIVEREGIVPTQ